jgi:hypothetical protein
MILHAQVNKDGTLTTKLPKSLWGKRIVISVVSETEAESDWKDIEKTFEDADRLDFPRRSHKEILRDLKAFRESE